MSEPNLNQRVRDGEITPDEADEIVERYWEREMDIDTDRKAEKQIRENENNGNH